MTFEWNIHCGEKFDVLVFHIGQLTTLLHI